MAEASFEEWGILEVMGHRRLGGLISEVQIGGAGFLRIDIPCDPPITQFYPPASVYCLTPTTEDMARAVAVHNTPQPVNRWELPSPKGPESATYFGCPDGGTCSSDACEGGNSCQQLINDEDDDPYDREDIAI